MVIERYTVYALFQSSGRELMLPKNKVHQVLQPPLYLNGKEVSVTAISDIQALPTDVWQPLWYYLKSIKYWKSI